MSISSALIITCHFIVYTNVASCCYQFKFDTLICIVQHLSLCPINPNQHEKYNLGFSVFSTFLVSICFIYMYIPTDFKVSVKMHTCYRILAGVQYDMHYNSTRNF